jgi:hypothetical protein
MITAVLSCRNAESTLERCLKHLLWHGARVIVIDNGSTDGTHKILRCFPGVEVRHDPYDLAFNLTRQLRMKRDIIREVGAGWIVNADADEFIDTAEGLPLKDVLPLWEPQGVVAFPAVELMYLPTSEDERHEPATFEATMQGCVRIAERDPKQRVFRATAPLERWLATGGHTVLNSGPELAGRPVWLRHYPGLSLDHIRAQYLARIFAADDLAKSWHTNRLGTAMTVVPTAPGVLSARADALTAAPMRGIPVLAALPDQRGSDGCGMFDLQVLAVSPAVRQMVAGAIGDAFEGLRIGRSGPMCPTLSVLEHPARSLGPESDIVGHAEHWLRASAGARQIGLVTAGAFAEIRIETIEAELAQLVDAVRWLLSGNVTAPAFAEASPVHRDERLRGRLADLTRPLATDLGYA